MNNLNFEQLFSALKNIRMTTTEKASVRINIARHMHQHPIGSRFYGTYFRPLTAAVFAVVLFLGSGTIVTFASQKALPGQTLYKVKLTTEQAKKVTLRTPEEKANYELTLIDKRFSETNKLVASQKLTTANEAIVAAAIKQHTEDFKKETSALSDEDPILALSYSTKLGNTLKTGTHILLALSDRQSVSSSLKSSDSVSPNTLVLAAYASAEKISAEKVQLESIVVSDTNIATIKTAEKRFGETTALLAKNNITPVIETPIATTMAITTASKIDTSLKMATEEKPVDLQTLANNLQTAYDAKKYGQVIILADQIEQLLHETQKIKEVEKAYNITISSDTSPKNEDSVTTSGTPINTTLEVLPELPTPSTTVDQKSN